MEKSCPYWWVDQHKLSYWWDEGGPHDSWECLHGNHQGFDNIRSLCDVSTGAKMHWSVRVKGQVEMRETLNDPNFEVTASGKANRECSLLRKTLGSGFMEWGSGQYIYLCCGYYHHSHPCYHLNRSQGMLKESYTWNTQSHWTQIVAYHISWHGKLQREWSEKALINDLLRSWSNH